MAIITKIEVQKNNSERANIYIDDKFYAGISIEFVVKYGLKKGMDVDDDLFQNVLHDDLENEAFNKSIKSIGSALKSKKQMKDYLKKKEYPSDIISQYQRICKCFVI